MRKLGTALPTLAAKRADRLAARRLMKVFLIIIALCLAFLGGFVIRGKASLLDAVGLSSLRVTTTGASSNSAILPSNTSLGARVSEVESVLKKNSLDSFDLDVATTTIFDSFAAITKDPYLRYFDANRLAVLKNTTVSHSVGIGVLFSEYEGRAFAVDVFDGSPAQAAGVLQGDVVVAINGDRSHVWSVAEVRAALNASPQGQVVITWQRLAKRDDTSGSELSTTLSIGAATTSNVTTSVSGNVGVIKVKQITQNCASLVQDALSQLAKSGASAYVLDLRDNPGGYLTQAVDIASFFIKSGTIVKIQTASSDESTKNATGKYAPEAIDRPLVVIINHNTAASAEVLAAALKDNQQATLIGENTMGKGSVQVTYDLSFGGALRYTAAWYKSPLGHSLVGAGVVPDMSIARSADGDNQKTLAIDEARSRIKGDKHG